MFDKGTFIKNKSKIILYVSQKLTKLTFTLMLALVEFKICQPDLCHPMDL